MRYSGCAPLVMISLCALGIAALAPNAAHANAGGTLLGHYTKLNSVGPHQNSDVNTHPITGLVTGRVATTLGPDGLPVSLDPALHDVNGSHEILWWTPDGTDVVAEKTQVDSAPLADAANFFPDSQVSDVPYTRAVHWSGGFILPTAMTVPMLLGADDDAWVFIDNTLAVDNGGIKPLTYSPLTSVGLSAGTHQIDIFFADRQSVQSGIIFDTPGANINFTASPSAAPEPCSLALLALGGGPLLALRRRRK